MNPLVLQSLTNGMYAIGVKDGDRVNACIVNTVMQISPATAAKPASLAVSVNRGSYSAECIEKSGIFTVSVLSEDTPAAVIGALGYVSGRNTDKLVNIRHKVLIEGVPVIKENTCCWFLCSVKKEVEISGQKLFIADVTAGSDKSVFVPMSYSFYIEKLKGRPPINSPAYLPAEVINDYTGGENFVCPVCGYIYSDQSFGFEELPNDWACPVCKSPKKAFVRRN